MKRNKMIDIFLTKQVIYIFVCIVFIWDVGYEDLIWTLIRQHSNNLKKINKLSIVMCWCRVV